MPFRRRMKAQGYGRNHYGTISAAHYNLTCDPDCYMPLCSHSQLDAQVLHILFCQLTAQLLARPGSTDVTKQVLAPAPVEYPCKRSDI